MAYLKINECLFVLLITIFFGYRNDGPFLKRNRPGFPTETEFFGNLSVARAHATGVISTMTVK
jgi:hypothetical protein